MPICAKPWGREPPRLITPVDKYSGFPQEHRVKIYRNWQDLPEDARGATIALGNFDGIHLGHVHLLRAAHAARPDAPLAVLTFEPHPRELFRPDDPPFRLTLSAERAEALAANHVAILYELTFDHEFSRMTAEQFVADVLDRGLGARHLASGGDFAFGHRRGGDTGFLATRAEALGMGMTIVPALADTQGPLSSTRIRRALQDGYPERATAELGRPWTIRGEVGMATSAAGRSASPPPTSSSAGIWSRRAASMP